jgi:hypothetical protein
MFSEYIINYLVSFTIWYDIEGSSVYTHRCCKKKIRSPGAELRFEPETGRRVKSLAMSHPMTPHRGMRRQRAYHERRKVKLKKLLYIPP